MIRIIVPLVIIMIGAVIVFSILRGGGLIRGVADGLFVSPARPSVAVVPARGFELTDTARVVLSPRVQGSGLQSTSVPVTYALFRHEGEAGPGRLLVLLAISDTDRMEWPVRPDAVFPSFRQRSVTIDGEEGIAETFVLPERSDPWRREASSVRNGESLVRRFTFLLWFRKAKLIVEYREPLPSSSLPLEDNLPLLAAFEGRARDAFALRSGDGLARPDRQPPYPPESVSRRELTRYIGELWENSPK